MDAFLQQQLDVYCGVFMTLGHSQIAYTAEENIIKTTLQFKNNVVTIGQDEFTLSEQVEGVQIFANQENICLEFNNFFAVCPKSDQAEAIGLIKNISECHKTEIE